MATTSPAAYGIDLESVYLIWLDASADVSAENIGTQKQLRSIILNFKTFLNVQDCEQYINEKTNYDRIFLIVSGRLGRKIVPCIHQLRQIFSIYVYCQDKQRNEEWANKFTKVKGVIVQSDALINQIQSDYSKRIQYQIDEPFPITIYKPNNLSDKSINDDYFHSQVLIDYLLKMKSIPTDKIQFINICLNEYHSNANELLLIQEFEQKYIPNQALWWYTRESFLSRLLNKALSIKNLDLLFLLAFFIHDIQKMLQKNQCHSSIQVYHKLV